MKKNLLLAIVALSINANGQTIINGDFESWPVGCPYNVAPDSWTNFSTGLGPDQAGTCAGTIVSYQGNSHMNLVWFTGSALAEGASQTITGLVIGQTYQISFEAINDHGLYSGTDDITLDFYLDGVIIFSTPTLVYGGTWTAYSVGFAATSTTHTIAFRVNTSAGSTVGSVGVDAVSINVSTDITEFTNTQINVYPNPTTGTFEISNSRFQIEEIKIYNLFGELVYSNSSPSGRLGGAIIIISQIPTGIYFAEIKTESGVVRKKVVKE